MSFGTFFCCPPLPNHKSIPSFLIILTAYSLPPPSLTLIPPLRPPAHEATGSIRKYAAGFEIIILVNRLPKRID